MLAGIYYNGDSMEYSGSGKIDELDYLSVLTEEIMILRSRIQPEDSGYLYTTISTLETRVEEIKEKIRANLHSK